MAGSLGVVILLVGPSCAGKSTLAGAVQTLSREPYLIQSLDGLFAAVPDAYGGSGEHTHEGFRYDRPAPEGGEKVLRIAYGPVGWRILEGFHRAVAAYARAGVNVVVDDMLLDMAVLEDWAFALASLPTVLVKVMAPEEELLRREQARTRRSTPGLAQGHFDLHQAIVADLDIDTSLSSPAEAAARVLALAAKARP